MNDEVVDLTALRADAGRIVADLTGHTVTSIEHIDRGVMAHKFVVAADRSYVVRFYPEPRRHVVDYEPALMRAARAAGVAAPDVVGDSRSEGRGGDATDPTSDLAYTVYEFVHGTTLYDVVDDLGDAEIGAIAEAVVDQLRRLETIDVRGWGELIEAHRGEHDSFADFVESVDSQGRALLTAATGGTLSLPAPPDALVDAASGRAPVIVFGDLHPSNVIVTDSAAFASLIDFESCIAGHPEANLGLCRAALSGTRFLRALERAMPAFDQPELVPLYSLVRALRLAPHLRSPLPTGAPRSSILDFLPGLESAVAVLS